MRDTLTHFISSETKFIADKKYLNYIVQFKCALKKYSRTSCCPIQERLFFYRLKINF